MNKPSASNTAPSTLPTLGDKPSAGRWTSFEAPKKARFGRKAVVGGVAGLLLVLSAGVAYAGESFTDTGGHTFESDIEWATDNGVAYGYPDGTFKPNAPVTRGAMTAFIHRYNQQTEKVTHSFTFTSTTAWSDVASCPIGKQPISGGGSISTTGAVMSDSTTDGDGGFHQRWESKSGAPLSGTGTTWAICVPWDS